MEHDTKETKTHTCNRLHENLQLGGGYRCRRKEKKYSRQISLAIVSLSASRESEKKRRGKKQKREQDKELSDFKKLVTTQTRASRNLHITLGKFFQHFISPFTSFRVSYLKKNPRKTYELQRNSTVVCWRKLAAKKKGVKLAARIKINRLEPQALNFSFKKVLFDGAAARGYFFARWRRIGEYMGKKSSQHEIILKKVNCWLINIKFFF